MERRKSWLMVIFSILIVLAVLINGCSAESSKLTAKSGYDVSEQRNFERIKIGFESITDCEIKEFINFLVSHELEGRLSGTKTNLITGEFLAKELESYGFAPLSWDDDFYQEFYLSGQICYAMSKYMLMESGVKPEEIDFEINPEKIAEIFNASSRNVIGILEGTDLKDEYVIFCAHYDHLGLWNNILYPGADDNASGTAALLEIAEAFSVLSKNGIKPRRNIVIIFFDAEEFGLVGSEYFVRTSSISFLENIATVINLDMVGRNNPTDLEIIGSQFTDEFPQRSPELYNAVSSANKILGFNLIYPQSFAASHGTYVINLSDQASFFGNGVKPVIFLHSGLHEDYHKSTDSAEKIDNKKVQNVARFSFLVGWQITNNTKKPSYFGGKISK